MKDKFVYVEQSSKVKYYYHAIYYKAYLYYILGNFNNAYNCINKGLLFFKNSQLKKEKLSCNLNSFANIYSMKRNNQMALEKIKEVKFGKDPHK